jgi:hypothetical protein
MSALLTTTMPYMKVVIDTMKEKGIRDDYIVLVGGAPLNEEFGRAIGADAYCRDAAVAVETAKEFIARKHNQVFAARAEDEFRAFYLTDFLARQFDAFVWEPLGLDRHPELRDTYFGHYEKLVYQAQTDDPALTAKAEDCARRLGLAFERRFTGYGDLAIALARVATD